MGNDWGDGRGGNDGRRTGCPVLLAGMVAVLATLALGGWWLL